MALKVYIGARYTPKFEGEWKANKEYAALSVIYSNNKSYVSRKTVPAGTAVTETEFWVESADWNAQVEQYNQNVTQYKAQVDLYNKNIETYTKQVNEFYADTLHSYETRDEMIADTNIKLGDTLLTCGKDAIGDGGGSFYQVVDTQSQKTVVLANGLYAEPFEFQPYDYAAFERKVDEYKAEVDQQLDEVEKYSLRNYDTTNKMVADKSLMTGNTVLTSGENSVGDGQGSFWKVVEQNSSDATALANGKFAKPFQLNPYEVSNRVTDNLNPDFKTGIPPCVWSGTVHGNGVNINLGTLPSHKQDDDSYKVDCTIFLNASFETTTERTSAFSIIHGGYAGLPALTYKFNVSGKNESATTTKTELIAVRLMAVYTDEAYSAAKGGNTIVTSWNSTETDIDYNAPEAITRVQTTADGSGIAYAWTGLPRTNSFFMPITAKKDGYTLSALHFTAGANVASVDDALWTITFSKYDDAATLHTANFYAVNGSEIDYNVNVGFALAKGTTYKMTFSGPEGAKLNFPTVAASAIQENEDVDVKAAPGYWNDNNTVVFSGTVELSKASTPSLSGYYTTTGNVSVYPTSVSEGKSTPGLRFDVVNTCTLNKINLTCTIVNKPSELTAIRPRITTYNGADVWVGSGVDVDSSGTFTLNNTVINIKLDPATGYTLDFIALTTLTSYRIIRPKAATVGTIVAGHDIVARQAELNDTSVPGTLVANVQSTSYTPTPGQTVVVYGDSKQTTKWTTIEYGFNQTTGSIRTRTPFTLKKNAKLTVEFTLNAKAMSSYESFTVKLTDFNFTPVSNTVAISESDPSLIKTYNISLTTTNTIPAGEYYITIESDRFNTFYYQTTSGTLTDNNYLKIPTNSTQPTAIAAAQALAKYTIITE